MDKTETTRYTVANKGTGRAVLIEAQSASGPYRSRLFVNCGFDAATADMRLGDATLERAEHKTKDGALRWAKQRCPLADLLLVED